MNRKFVLGIAAGAATVAIAAARVSRARLAISFDDRVVVITGGSRGLGLVMARMFADEGAKVALLARDMDELERAKEDLDGRPGEIMTLRCDVRRRADVRAAIDTVLDRWRTVDVLVNNAGVIQVGPIEHMAAEDFENAMATHFWGPLHLILEVLPTMRHRGFGRIVNISSIGGRIAVPHLGPYSASKFALTGLSDALRAELDRYGIRVTTVTPGLMRTGSPMNAQFKGQHEAEYGWFKLSSSIPGMTVAAERAARRILNACRYGDPSLTITAQAALMAAANGVAPSSVARAMMLVARLLPGPAGIDGGQIVRGRDTQPVWAPRLVTALTDRAAAANNEI
jgi:NAD(P)-dependent dehydrogenase (short-subunit alcohol dehydrogenase family)